MNVKLSSATTLLFWVAAESHSLAEVFGCEIIGEGTRMEFKPIPRPWLLPHGVNTGEVTFDPDIFAKDLDRCSTGQRHMKLFILNVWNPQWARSKGWNFDLFKAMDSLDAGNKDAITKFITNPIWP